MNALACGATRAPNGEAHRRNAAVGVNVRFTIRLRADASAQ
jgi:hypothetical protein